MGDVVISVPQVQSPGGGYLVPEAQEIVLKAVRAAYNGASAAGSYVPMLQIYSDAGILVAECPVGSTLAAGASADVSWFSGLKPAATAATAAANPLIIDYFDNAGSPYLTPDTPYVLGGGPVTVESVNWVYWFEEANWSGYNTPQPWIGVDDVIVSNDTYGVSAKSRWLLVPEQGTDSDFVTPGGSALIKVEFSMDLSSLNSGVSYDVQPMQTGALDYGSYSSTSDLFGIGAIGNYGYWSDFPVTLTDGHRPRGNLTYYQQIDQTGVYMGFGFIIRQTFPDSSYFDNQPYCQCVITLLKNGAFTGERGG